MASKPKKHALNVYLAKTDVAELSDIIKDPDSLAQWEIQVTGLRACTLVIKKAFSNLPKWSKFFEGKISDKEFGKNSSTGAALYAHLGNSRFIITFGMGRHLIDSSKIEMNFGLKVALNSLDVSTLRSIDKASFEAHPTQSREQTGIATELKYFGLDVEQDLLRAITGKPRDAALGGRLSGMDSVKLNVEVDLEKLPKLLKKLEAAYKDDLYKKGVFAFVDHIGEVKDKTLKDSLDTELIKRINANQIERIWLSVPEIIDWDRVVGFRYSMGSRAARLYDIRLSEFIESLNKPAVDGALLRSRKIYCVDSEDLPIFDKPAYYFVYAEVTFDNEVYLLNNGKWYKIGHDYADQVNQFFSNIPKYEKPLPIYDDETEGDYNQRVCVDNPQRFALLDKKNIKITGAASVVEPCDLYDKDKEFIHVKRYSGSSVLSHLFNQGLVSGELFQMSVEYREILNSKLPKYFSIAESANRPKPNEYKVVFAIISESDADLSIPFFSKISIRHVTNRLEAIGFNVLVAKVSVAELRKKTKKYAASKQKI